MLDGLGRVFYVFLAVSASINRARTTHHINLEYSNECVTNESVRPFGIVRIPDTKGGTTITCIGKSIFTGCINITGVIIPSSIILIEDQAFENCTNLEFVTFKSSPKLTTIGNRAFANCESLQNITLPNSLATIGEFGFFGCKSLSSIAIPRTLKTLGTSAFGKCYSLIEITVEHGNTAFLSHNGALIAIADSSLVQYPIARVDDSYRVHNVRTIKSYSFADSSHLHNVEISMETGVIEAHAFQNCGNLTDVKLPATLFRIDSHAFYNCSSLLFLNMTMTNVAEISKYAFSRCSNLIDVSLPSNLKVLEKHAFSHCTQLKNLSIPASVNTIKAHAFFHCKRVRMLDFPANSNLTAVGASAFSFMKSLTEVRIPRKLRTLSDSMFANCSRIRVASIPSTVREIGDKAFFGCSSLESSVLLSRSIERLGKRVFDGTLVQSLFLYSCTANVTEESAYGNIKCVMVPESCEERYVSVFGDKVNERCKAQFQSRGIRRVSEVMIVVAVILVLAATAGVRAWKDAKAAQISKDQVPLIEKKCEL